MKDKNFFKSKKFLIIFIIAILFIFGFTFKIFYNSNSLDNLIGCKYKIVNVTENDTVVRYNVITKGKKQEIIELSKKLYEKTADKDITINVVKDENSKDFKEFYDDILKYKIFIDRNKKILEFVEFGKLSEVEKNLKIENNFKIERSSFWDGKVSIDMKIQNIEAKDAMAFAKGFLDIIKKTNPDKKELDEVILNMTNQNEGFVFYNKEPEVIGIKNIEYIK